VRGNGVAMPVLWAAGCNTGYLRSAMDDRSWTIRSTIRPSMIKGARLRSEAKANLGRESAILWRTALYRIATMPSDAGPHHPPFLNLESKSPGYGDRRALTPVKTDTHPLAIDR
jgi:hypothetical protein